MNAERAWGGHSMVAPLRRVLVYPPVPPDESVDWETFGYLRPVNHEQAREEHEALRQLLANEGVEVVSGEIDSGALQDAIFPFDPVIMTDAGAILTRMGKPLREREVDLAAQTMADLGIPIAGRIVEPGLLEGGDCLWIDDRTLAVGRGYRTNGEGIRQLAELLAPMDVQVHAFDLPHWNGPGECLHLLSLISMLDERLAVVHKPLMAVALVELLAERGVELVEIPEEEFVSQGCNVLAVAPRRCVMLRENVTTAERLRAAGCEVTLYTGDEISHNRTGGPTCLTRPILRG
jgi:N-dimethylarginine dimethylaminohydrolase